MSLLEVADLRVHLFTSRGIVRAVDGTNAVSGCAIPGLFAVIGVDLLGQAYFLPFDSCRP